MLEIIITVMCLGDDLEIMGRARKLSERVLTHENLLKIQLKVNKLEKKGSEKTGTFFLKMGKVESDIRTLSSLD